MTDANETGVTRMSASIAEPSTNQTGTKPAVPAGRQLPEPCEKTTFHSMQAEGHEIRYAAKIGTILIDTPKVKPAASVFYTSFELLDANDRVNPERPVTFIFNGGPGSSTTFLLMGSIAPKRIDVPDAAPVPAAPYHLADNPHTLLPASDLVFIDAPGAGFSEILDAAKPELWSVDGDVAGFSAFIRAYLSSHRRWNSPKYVLGESYGTTRGAALAYRLQQDGVALNGLTLISNILDYAYTLDTSDQFYIGYFPTFASVARYHGRAANEVEQSEHLRAARAFANGPLRLALAAGASLPDDVRHRVAERYAELTGLDAKYVYDSDLRVVDMRFRKELLRDEGRIVGRYDGRVAGYDLDRMNDEETFVVDDAFLDPAYSSLANAYLRDELGWDRKPERVGFADFDWNATTPGKGWTWWHKQPDMTKSSWGQNIPFPNVVPDLAAAIAHQPTLKVLIGNGVYDLCTPFFQTEYDIDHLGLPKPLRGNVAFTYYPAGHMLYSSVPSLAKFSEDLKRFYASDVTGLRAIDERPAAPIPDIQL
ncbi:S10 family peptidase [Bifidobacterium callitrichos]|uniref:Peptidase S10, serine carboxypeptidase n=1 Tax=Bifidobacterium callitrichos DSM 23973 TaxID=1437609 RepID=A0A086ZZF3_9BIFI|nr:carboxypeptidase [Bifidobacterium callitrichos]KFI51903.1 peptidase S10, serine carboxypeptidase [Bifidobacterium callitrichos DSM 23973]